MLSIRSSCDIIYNSDAMAAGIKQVNISVNVSITALLIDNSGVSTSIFDFMLGSKSWTVLSKVDAHHT